MSRPWMKFYPADWRDARLRACSLAARGLWIDLMSYMHEAAPYGHLLIADKRPSITEIALQVGRPINEVKKAFKELETSGVFSVTDGEVIFSRRMVRDFKKAEVDKANGKAGGNPDLKALVNPPVNITVNGEDKAHIPETRGQGPERKEDAAGAASSVEKYAFESGVIRLTKKDFEQWKALFSYLDVPAELLTLTQFAQKNLDSWFFAVQGALGKRNREVKAAREKNPDQFKWRSGIEGVV